MIRVMIVDDDNLARMYLRQIIDWEKEGCALVGDAQNGRQALERAAALAPDIILTDISMPVMDGVELIRTLREQSCPARIAVLSCHDEFEYVKEAMRLGADEYVLKNTLDADGLRALLKTLSADLEKSRAAREQQKKLMDLAAEGSRSVLRDAVRRLREGALDYETQKALLEQSGVSLPFYQCAAVLVQPCKSMEVLGRYAAQNGACSVEDGEACVLLLKDLTGISSAGAQRDALARFAADLPLEGSVAAVSGLCAGDGGLTRAIEQAQQAMKNAFYGKMQCRYDELPAFADALPEQSAQALALAQQPACNAEKFASLFTAALDMIERAPVEPHAVRGWISRLDEACGQPQAVQAKTLADCRARLAFYQRVLAERAQRSALQAANPAVAQAVAYIRAHFAEPISLAQVADEVALNPTYLSFVFKRDTGVNFSEYLLACRLDEVKRRLQETTLPIKDVAEAAGFLDYRHFCKLFKKEIGLRPADFRKQS